MTPPATRFFFLRHGAVDPAWQGRLYGNLDVALSAEGEREAVRSAAALSGVRLDAVVSSGLARTEFTAALLREGRGLARRDEPALREIDRGAWRGRTAAQVDAEEAGAWTSWLADPVARRPPAGESLADLAARVLPKLDELAAELAAHDGAVAIVAHSWVLRIATCRVLDVPLDRAPAFDVVTGGIVALDWSVGDAARPTLVGFGLDRPPDASRAWFRQPPRR